MAVRATRRRRSLTGLHPDAAGEATFLLPRGVFVAPASTHREEPRRVGPLSEYVTALAARPHPAGALLGGALGEAWSYAQQLTELRFCLTQLLPLLRSFSRPGPPDGEATQRIPVPGFRAVERRAAELRRRLDRPVPPVESPDVLAVWLGAPCAIVSKAVVPLERVARATPAALHVTIDGDRYRLCTEQPRSLQALAQAVRRETKRRAERILTADPELTRMAAEFLEQVESILDRWRPRDLGRYRLFHRDRDHQLQHHGGHWVLVRGPVASRTANGSLFVGLYIKGRTRAERLALAPRPSPTQETLWTPQGRPATGGLCMGGRDQYQLLLSDHFTDAEAVVHWLDAGVILATGRSDFHRCWRERFGGRFGHRTPDI